MSSANDAKQIYKRVIDDVCTAVREALSREGYDDHTLQELKTLWLAKVNSSKALEPVTTSAVDEATSRNHRRPTANNDTNHSASVNNKQTTTMRPATFHPASMTAMSSFTVPYTTAPIMNNGNLTMNNTGVAFMNPSHMLNRLQNPTSMGNSITKTANQLDGANDEAMPASKTTKKKSNGRRKKSRTIQISFQVDGTGPPITDDEDDEEDNAPERNDAAEELDDDDDDDGNEEGNEDTNPLCSDDDVSDDEPAELFETDNVVVCQYDKISRTKNKWRFVLKSGVMNINGHDYVFSKANGEADW